MLFDRKTIEAGKDVLKHWEEIINNPLKKTGITYCPYCKLYAYNTCLDCPIYFFTYESACRNTPYLKYLDAKSIQDSEKIFELSTRMKEMLDEIFIKSLLLFDIRKDYFEIQAIRKK